MLRHFEDMWAFNGSTQDIFTADRQGRPLRHPHSEAISTFLLFFEKLERLSQYTNGNHNKKSPCKFHFFTYHVISSLTFRLNNKQKYLSYPICQAKSRDGPDFQKAESDSRWEVS